MGQPKAQRCAECGHLVAGEPNLYLGRVCRGVRLCATCVTAFQGQTGVPSRLTDFVRWYQAKHHGNSQVARLKDRIAELEAQLDELTAPTRRTA